VEILYLSSDDARRIFPAICFEPDGIIIAPQLREAYAHTGIYLHDPDFQVLWDRYTCNILHC
jgi:hypothetical protein